MGAPECAACKIYSCIGWLWNGDNSCKLAAFIQGPDVSGKTDAAYLCLAGVRLGLTRLHLNDSMGLFPLVICTACGVALPLVAYWISRRIWKLEVVFYPTKFIKIREQMNLKQKRMRKIIIAIKLTLCGNGYKKAEYLKKRKIFSEFGEKNY